MLLRPADYQRSLSFTVTGSGWRLPVNAGPAQCFSPVSHCSNWPVRRAGPFAGTFPGALWLQVRDLEAAQTELVSRRRVDRSRAHREPWGLHEIPVMTDRRDHTDIRRGSRVTRCVQTRA